MVRSGVGGFFILMLTGAILAPVTAIAQSPPKGEPVATDEALPWLAPAGAPASPEKKPAKTSSKAPVKCEEQDEDGCRTATNCAWVAHIPQADGSVTPARCAEKKVPGAPAKPKTTATKPKPKPEEKPAADAAVPPATEQTAKPSAVTTTPASPEAKSEPAAPPVATNAPAGGSQASEAASDAQPAVQAVVKVPAEITPPTSGSTAISPAVVEPVKPQQP